MSIVQDVKDYLGDKYDESQEFMYNVYANIENLPDNIANKFNDSVNRAKDYLFYHKNTDENGLPGVINNNGILDTILSPYSIPNLSI